MSWVPGQAVTSRQDALGLAATAMQSMGHPDAQVVGDAVRAARALALVALGGGEVQRSELHALVGARGYETSSQLFVFTSVGASASALQYAQHMDIVLVRFDPAGRLTALSPAAQRARPRPPVPGKVAPAAVKAEHAKRWWRRSSGS